MLNPPDTEYVSEVRTEECDVVNCSLQWFVSNSTLATCFTYSCSSNCCVDRIVPLRSYLSHRISRSGGRCFLLGRSGVQIPTHEPAMLTKVFRVLPPFHEDVIGMVPHIRPQSLSLSCFPIYFSLFILTHYVV
jgi:hypothetical protein